MAPSNNSKLLIANDPRWQAVSIRDHRADGSFVYAVKTTGVYCRPSCASRMAKPEHVEFFDNNAEAERAGYRPCKRCKPQQASLSMINAEIVANACRLIESSEAVPTLKVLADHVGLSTFHFHRLFKATTGLTPKAYASAQQRQRIQQTLSHSNSVTGAIYDAGYSSNSRFYQFSNQMLGMTPTKYRRGGLQMTIRFAIGICSMGNILVAASDIGVCAILFGDDPNQLAHELQDKFPQANLIGGDDDFDKLVATVVGFVENPVCGLDLPLDIRGTAFQQRVWQALRQIKPGTTASYSQIAESIGAPKAVRAVAGACAANTLAVAIPCHRVVRQDGSLSGYRWGVERKQTLLKKEGNR